MTGKTSVVLEDGGNSARKYMRESLIHSKRFFFSIVHYVATNILPNISFSTFVSHFLETNRIIVRRILTCHAGNRGTPKSRRYINSSAYRTLLRDDVRIVRSCKQYEGYRLLSYKLVRTLGMRKESYHESGLISHFQPKVPRRREIGK